MKSRKDQKINTVTGIAIVVANMIGTGVFTSLGFQVVELQNPAVIVSLWLLGGLLALAGALSYTEVGTLIKKSGGEYIFLSEIYSPFIGYLAGWISLTVGFAAPVALSAIAIVSYFPYLNLNPVWGSIIIVFVITLIHSINLKSSAIFQNTSTILKIALITILIIVGLVKESPVHMVFIGEHYTEEVFSSAFIIALIYVGYSYSGWNAAVYISEEFKDLRRSLIYALLGGTIFVAVIYTLLQFIFLKHVPLSELVGQVDVGAIAATKLFGSQVGNIFSLAVSLLLISSLSAMIWVGPRVTSSMAKDHNFWKFFRSHENHVPIRAIWLQFAITTLLLLTGTFEQILIYCGFLLTMSSMLTVFGVILLRQRGQHLSTNEAFKGHLYPYLQIVYIAFALVIIVFAFIERPWEAIWGMMNLLLGGGTWILNRKLKSEIVK